MKNEKSTINMHTLTDKKLFYVQKKCESIYNQTFEKMYDLQYNLNVIKQNVLSERISTHFRAVNDAN